VRSDPRLFVEALRPPAIFDGIQNAPELLNYIRTRVDLRPGRRGQWFLTGSQEAPLMRGVSESAGRAAVFQLLPFSLQETPKVSILGGGFPELPNIGCRDPPPRPDPARDGGVDRGRASDGARGVARHSSKLSERGALHVAGASGAQDASRCGRGIGSDRARSGAARAGAFAVP
jgi:hypothetical protein